MTIVGRLMEDNARAAARRDFCAPPPAIFS
jgi:hypothetical protein